MIVCTSIYKQEGSEACFRVIFFRNQYILLSHQCTTFDASCSPCSLCALVLPSQTLFHFHSFAAVQLSSYRSSGDAVLKTAYDKIMTKLEKDPKLQLSTALINQVTDKCFKRATSHSRDADLSDTVLDAKSDPTNKPCPGCRQCPIHCMRDGSWRPKPSKFENIKSPRPDQRAARAPVANLDEDIVKNLAVLSLQGKLVDLDSTLAQAMEGPPATIDETQKVFDLLAMAAQWSDVSGDSDVSSDEIVCKDFEGSRF